MKLSDILGADVVAADGEHLGNVTDVRLERSGPLVGTFGASYRIDGLVVSRARAGSYLGYDRSDMHGPALVRAIVRWLHRGSVYVGWADVNTEQPGRIIVSRPRRELGAPPQLPPRRL
jgi:hypothetical protein